ncbi:MAG: class I SAM-dependent RNA methyltransferase [Acidobacteriota bacterium]
MKDRKNLTARLAELDEVEVTVEKLIAGGEGLARFEGIPLFIPRAAPGDRLRARLVQRRSGFGRAEIVEVIEPGPDRRHPPCSHFAECGGCDLQHLEDRAQVRHKSLAVAETLRHLSGLDLPVPEILAGDAWGYRSRTQLHTRITGDERPEVGYYARGSQVLVPVEQCPVLAPPLEGWLAKLPAHLEVGAPKRVDLVCGDGGRVSTAPPVEGLPQGALRVTVRALGRRFGYEFDARCFFQGHRGLVGALIDRVVGPWRGQEAFDLYAGVGLFAVPLGQRYRRVTAVEGDRVAVRYARRNLRANGVADARVHAQALETWIGHLADRPDRVVVDPPRQGLAARVRQVLLHSRPRRLTYVSCHPATFARDLKALAVAYRIESLVLVDLFPQTGHMEVVAQLVLADDALDPVNSPASGKPN